MRNPGIIAGILTFLVLAPAASAAPCTSATAACTQWVSLGSVRAMVYRTYPLDVPNPQIRRALIMGHAAQCGPLFPDGNRRRLFRRCAR